MIDTIVLAIPREKLDIVDLTYYGVPKWDLKSRTGQYTIHVKNPSAKDEEGGLYFPRLTGIRRKKEGDSEWTSLVKIEFSAPKLLYKNNLDELSEGQFPAVVDALHHRLEHMGVRINRQTLEDAPVSSIHYSRNIELTKGYTAQYAISELGKINLNKRFDFARARFLNDGQSLCAHTTTHEFVMYDKIADLAKGPKRSIDRDQTKYQLNLFEKFNDVGEVLRIEARLSKKRKMNSLFKQLGFGENPTFKDVFSEEKSKKVLLYYWNTMIEKNSLLLFAHSLTAKDLLRQILIARQTAKSRTALYLTGLLLLAREGNGLRELRAILSKRSTDRTWHRIYADLNETTEQLNRLRPREWFDQIKYTLEHYKPFNIK